MNKSDKGAKEYMSGGSMNYLFHHIEDAADYVDDKEIKDLIKDLAKLLHDLEWYESGDYSSSDYYETLDEFKAKWFGDNRNERLKEYIAETLHTMEQEIDKLLG